MNSLADIQKTVSQFTKVAELESINVGDWRCEDDNERLAIMKTEPTPHVRYNILVRRGFYDLSHIIQREWLIELVAEVLYFKENMTQYFEMDRQRKNDPDFMTSRFEELRKELRTKINRTTDPEA